MGKKLAIGMAVGRSPNRPKNQRLTSRPDLRRLFQEPSDENFAVMHLRLGLLAVAQVLQTSDSETARDGHADLLVGRHNPSVRYQHVYGHCHSAYALTRRLHRGELT